MEKNKNYKDFFLTNNKSGLKTRENYLNKNFPSLHKEIIDFTSDSLSHLPFKQKIWHFIYNVDKVPTCGECGKELKFKKSLKEGYGKYCSIKCTNTNKEHIEKSKESRKEKEEEILEKMKKTTQKKYGVDNIFQRKDIIQKSFQEKYGVDHVSKVDGVREKIETTNKERYGVKSVLSLKENQQTSYDSRRDTFQQKYEHLNVIDHIGEMIKIKCDKCDEVYEIYRPLLYYRDKHNIEPCLNCNPKNSQDSYHEKEIVDFIKSLGVEVIENDRKLLKPKEIDVVIPSHKLCIEFNGVYWHNELYVDKNYHLDKTKECNEKGYELIHIFQDEWVYKKDIVKSIIRNKLSLNNQRIYARKCTAQPIKNEYAKTFLNENHIQGNVNSSIKLGLYYCGELVSVMTFGRNRKVLGQTHVHGEWEMLRYCNKLNVSVIGGASKLFKYFINEYIVNKITSYSDNRFFNGKLYESLGFKFSHDTTPNYFYVVNDKRENRFNYRKDVLVSEGFNPNKTEHQIMLDRGIYRIYDCGNKKWVYEKP